MFERDDGRALGDSFVECANLKSHLVLRYFLIFFRVLILHVRVDHRMLVFFLQHEFIDLLDPTQLTVKLEPLRYMHRVKVLISSVIIFSILWLRLFAFFLTKFLDFI
jgi:hypothetical protein